MFLSHSALFVGLHHIVVSSWSLLHLVNRRLMFVVQRKKSISESLLVFTSATKIHLTLYGFSFLFGPTPLFLLNDWWPTSILSICFRAITFIKVYNYLCFFISFFYAMFSSFLKYETLLIFSLRTFSAYFLCKCDLLSCFPIPPNSGLSSVRSGLFFEGPSGANNFYIALLYSN